MRTSLRIAAAAAVAFAIACGALGWLYLLRTAGALDAGPAVAGALPLQRLAGGEAEPLARLLAAWLGAGAVEAVLLAALLRTGRAARAGFAAALAFVALVVVGALSDAVTASEPVGAHVLPQLSRAGVWVAVGTLAACALIPAPTGRAAGTMRRGAGASEDGAGRPRPA